MEQVSGQCDVQKNKLVDVRMNYLQNHPKRDFSASAENNDDYDSLLSELSCNELEEYQKKAAEQAKAAVSILRRILYTRSAALSKKPMCAGMN